MSTRGWTVRKAGVQPTPVGVARRSARLARRICNAGAGATEQQVKPLPATLAWHPMEAPLVCVHADPLQIELSASEK